MLLVRRGCLDLATVIRCLTVEPARAFSLPHGSLRRGADADVTIFDPDLEWEVEPGKFYSKGKNTPLAGVVLRGKVVMTLVGGRVVYRGQE